MSCEILSISIYWQLMVSLVVLGRLLHRLVAVWLEACLLFCSEWTRIALGSFSRWTVIMACHYWLQSSLRVGQQQNFSSEYCYCQYLTLSQGRSEKEGFHFASLDFIYSLELSKSLKVLSVLSSRFGWLWCYLKLILQLQLLMVNMDLSILALVQVCTVMAF